MTYDMSDILDLHLKHFVKVKVKKIENENGQKRSTYEYFTLDPQTANYCTLRKQLAHLFQIDGEFSVSFKKDKVYIPLTSDWDLDGAISEASKPYLSLAIELQPLDKTLEEWDIICPADIPPMEHESRCSDERRSLAGSIISQVENAVVKLQRAFSFDFNNDALGKPFVDEAVYMNLLDAEGRVINHRDLYRAVYRGGVEPSLRPTVWKHLLNVFPFGMTLEERKNYMNNKCEEYYQLRYRWQHLMRAGTIPDVLQDITNMVRKDVRRTDRTEKFYSGSDDNGNIRALFNILTTYAVNHPNISYCQGMSDLLSPILYVMKKESDAYVCFCGLMKRTHMNFRLDGRAMKLKFRHLQKMLRFYDQELYMYLKDEEALDLLFCYRWLLLNLKREFPYNEMLNMMEILWASLPPKPPRKEIDLYDVKFPTAAICNELKDRTTLKDYMKIDEDHFGASHDGISFSNSITNNTTAEKIKKWAMRVRRESIARTISGNESSGEEEITLPLHYRKRKYRSYIAGKLGRMNRHIPPTDLTIRSCRIPKRKNSLVPEICQSWSCGEVFEEKQQDRDALYDAREFLRNQWCYSNTVNEIQLNNWLNGRQFEVKKCAVGSRECDSVIAEENNRQRHGSSDSNYSAISDDFSEGEVSEASPPRSRRSQSEGYMSDADSKVASTLADEEEDDEVYDSEDDEDYDDYSDDEYLDSMGGRQYEEVQTYFDRKKEMLPPPHILGDGNPFLLFLCIAMIESHRNEILRRRFDFNELGIYFDKFVRKHKLYKVLRNAQKMFTDYLNMGWDIEDKGEVSDG